MRSLKHLLKAWHIAVSGTSHCQPPRYHGPDVKISHFTEKTSEVTPGACFVARVRTNSDGHPYINTAIAKGAKLILAQRPPSESGIIVPEEVAYLQVDDTAEALAWLAAAWEGFPSRDLVTIGITGTDGKTTTANILAEILRTAGVKVGLLSTVRAVIGDAEEPLALHVTTPEAPEVQRYLRRMLDAGMTHCILESTSHGLAQHRVTAVDFDIAALTNITHEHLDYHGDYESYFAAKARLFQQVDDPPLPGSNGRKSEVARAHILNRDDSSYRQLYPLLKSTPITYGIHSSADVTASGIKGDIGGTRFTLHFGQVFQSGERTHGEVRDDTCQIGVSSPLLGEFNVYNMLAAAAVARHLGLAPELIRDGLQSVASVDGRMERIDLGQPFSIIVDFAHTPNALRQAIETSRRLAGGRIITVFGSAGKRDVEKRSLMAEISAEDADFTVLTAEDPRTESLEIILETMAEGCRRAGGREGQTFWRIPDRGRAIYFALTLAEPGDLVLVCGKGHEQSMCFGTREYSWDDRAATGAALQAYLGDRPVPDLGLPTFR